MERLKWTAAAVLTAAVVMLGGCKEQGAETAGSRQGQSEQQNGKVAASAEEAEPLEAGDTAPSARLRTAEGEAVELADVLGGEPTVLVFYRGGWCRYCTAQLAQLSGTEQAIVDAGWQIVAISPDRPEKLRESRSDVEVDFTLLSDSSMAAAKAYGLAFEVDAETLEKYAGYGIDLEEASGRDHHLLPVPAVFLVGADGVIRYAYANPDYTVRLEAETLLEQVREE